MFAMGKCGALVRNRNPVATATYMRLADLCRDEFQSLGLVESIPASDSLVLKFADRIDMALLQSQIEKLADPATRLPVTVGKTHVMTVDFSAGLDWEFATGHTGISREEYIESLCSAELTVAMLGFLPGFAYLEGRKNCICLAVRRLARVSNLGQLRLVESTVAFTGCLAPADGKFLGKSIWQRASALTNCLANSVLATVYSWLRTKSDVTGRGPMLHSAPAKQQQADRPTPARAPR